MNIRSKVLTAAALAVLSLAASDAALARRGADDAAGHVRQEDRRADRQQDRQQDRQADRQVDRRADRATEVERAGDRQRGRNN